MEIVRARDVAVKGAGGLRELRCPECRRLLVRVAPKGDGTVVETACRCGARAEWTLRAEGKAHYRLVEKRV